MPAYFNQQTGKWYCKFYYRDAFGKNKAKKKSGFKLKREALEWERNFLENYQMQPDVTMSTLCDNFLRIQRPHIKPLTYKGYESTIRNYIKPILGDMAISEITPFTIEEWQQELLKKGFKPSTLKGHYATLKSVFNFAVSHYSLKESPCKKVKPIAKPARKGVDYITLEEYNQLVKHGGLKAPYLMMVKLLFWTGMRYGELLALTPADFSGNTITINKNLVYVEKQQTVQDSPKTQNSIRKVELHQKLADELRDYISRLYGIEQNDLIFPYDQTTLRRRLNAALETAGVKKIRVHDLRHSHVTLMIHLGYSPVYIGERIGDTAQTVLQVYAHVYESDRRKLMQDLESLDK